MLGLQVSREQRKQWSRGDSPRSGEPVWRNSYYVGQIEDRIWRPINGGRVRDGKRWTRALLKAARSFERSTREKRRETEPGARNGALGPIGIEVLDYLYEVVDYATGRLEPAVRTIAEAIGYSYSAVHDALVRLRAHGFINWMRRSKPVEEPKPGGQQVEQASNAYALLVPEGMRKWLSRLVGRATTPECEEARRERERAEFQRMLDQLTATEFIDHHFDRSTLLGETLRRLATAVDRREAHRGESGRADETGGL
ncbi:hypothetical protein V5F89_12575 [Pelagerythrobacter marensis]|uniref:Uncharacterized protein n=1 Tax=Pelagerythrobacter marensis TaxID=543877 RepID=A0ABZ2D9P3_9SPHN